MQDHYDSESLTGFLRRIDLLSCNIIEPGKLNVLSKKRGAKITKKKFITHNRHNLLVKYFTVNRSIITEFDPMVKRLPKIILKTFELAFFFFIIS